MQGKKKKHDSLLIIFYRNPELGKVKTRLAASIGDARAYSIYLLLANHTREVTHRFPCDKVVFYSDFVDEGDGWFNRTYKKQLQQGADLGERMENAFRYGFSLGYQSICIIGTDCLDLKETHLQQAFRKVLTHDVVIGPASDGGYYLLGMNRLHVSLFRNKPWSTSLVCQETLAETRLLGLTTWELAMLNDIDEERDLPAHFLV